MKQSGYLARMKAIKAAELRHQRLFTMQRCCDAAVMAANDVFKRKGETVSLFVEKFMEYAKSIAELTLEDAMGDRTIEYTKAKVDERLKEILGENFEEWEVRYNIR